MRMKKGRILGEMRPFVIGEPGGEGSPGLLRFAQQRNAPKR